MKTITVEGDRIQGYLTLNEIAEIFDVTKMSVENMLWKGRFGNGVIKLASRTWLLDQPNLTNNTFQNQKNSLVTVDGDRIRGYSTHIEVAQKLGVTKGSVSRMIREGRFDDNYIVLTAKIWVPESDITKKSKLYKGARQMFKVRQCVVCGKDYIPTNGRQKICKSVDCQRELWRWKHRRQKYGHKQPGKPLVKPNTLVSDAMDAKEAGMSYGQYMASKFH